VTKKKKPKILFITRKYPPSIGGMQKVNFELYTHLARLAPTCLVAWGGSQKWILPVYPFLFLKGLIKTISFKPDVIYFGDAGMTFAAVLIKALTGKKITCTVHGLDVTLNFPGYQKLISFFLPKFDKLVCVSTATQKEGLKRGVSKKKTKVIPDGINPNEYFINKTKEEIRKELETILRLNFKGKKILLTIGRLVKRKGHEWFIRNIVPKLSKNVIYLVAGDGPERVNIKKAIKEKDLESQVFLLGRVAERVKKLLYNSADLFIMPNIHIEGDLEGFGIVALEASSAGLPVVASSLEGIKNAIEDGKNGYLVESRNSQEFVKKITEILNNPTKYDTLSKSTRRFSQSFSWDKTATQYLKTLNAIIV
jgi:glycosyltransferase involved in cell wall biosynthesis